MVGTILFIYLFAMTNESYTCMLMCSLHCSAQDSLEFVIQWLERFPRYKNRELYITGESYAGHYVPQLAKEILTYNAKTKHPINLKGIMVNPQLSFCIYNHKQLY